MYFKQEEGKTEQSPDIQTLPLQTEQKMAEADGMTRLRNPLLSTILAL